MTYIAIRKDALEEIIADRVLQSVDFPQGDTFIKSVQSLQETEISGRLSMKVTKTGLLLFGREPEDGRFVVFDVTQAGGLGASDSSANALLYLQKTARFAIRYWQGGVLKRSEVINSDLNRGIVFPFPISQQTKIRIVIDLAPDADRMVKRGRAGRFLLAFKIAEDGANASEGPSLATFRRFLDDLDSLGNESLVANSGDKAPFNISGLRTTSLSDLKTQVDPHQAYETWMHLLTNDQKEFVTTPLESPRRVDGPAGSGKTVALALAAIHAVKQNRDPEYRAIFFTHSEASRRSIETILRTMGGDDHIAYQANMRGLRVTTLQGFCAEILRQDLSATEFVDPDAYDAKQLQTMYVEEALRRIKDEIPAYERFMSRELRDYILNEDEEVKVALLQHEISIVIKGRSRESLDIYKRIPPISSGLPIRNEEDKGFIWRVYELYRDQLVDGGQFDTDDVVLTALSQLSTPIWRRRRERDGFDALFVDETHLFNMNELSVFHHLTKSATSFPIAFAVDRSQAIGDRGWSDDIDVETLVPNKDSVQTSKVDLRSIFRSSPDIVNLAFTITSSGANLFTNFDDPLALAHSNMTFEDEKKAREPTYSEFINDAEMVENAFIIADEMREQIGTSRGEVAIIAFTEELFREIEKLASHTGKPIEVIKQRGDDETAGRAKTTGRFVISMADYVGGLEFDGVVLVGVDQGRVPPVIHSHLAESRAYMTFASHNKLYVAISRARYRVAILGTKERGHSPILEPAFASNALKKEQP